MIQLELPFTVPSPPAVSAADLYMAIAGSGVVYFDDPKPSDFETEPVAHTLANIARYAGNYGRYGVAQHAVLVARVVAHCGGLPHQILAAIHHDDSEAVTNDIPRPLKEYLRRLTPELDNVIHRIERAIENKYLIDTHDPLVKWADMAVYHWEVQCLIPPEERFKYLPLPDVDGMILPYRWFVPWSHEEAFARYMDVHAKTTRLIANKEVPDDLARIAN